MKLISIKRKHTVTGTEKQLLGMKKSLKELKKILLGQRITMFTNKDLMRDILGRDNDKIKR